MSMYAKLSLRQLKVAALRRAVIMSASPVQQMSGCVSGASLPVSVSDSPLLRAADVSLDWVAACIISLG
jgi:hypothetical protein